MIAKKLTIIIFMMTVAILQAADDVDSDVYLRDLEDEEDDDFKRSILDSKIFEKVRKIIPNILQLWRSFVKKYSYHFEGLQKLHRFNLFMDSCYFIQMFNTKNKSFELGVNRLAAMTDDEFNDFLGTLDSFNKNNTVEIVQGGTHKVDLTSKRNGPESIDWRSRGVLFDIRDQTNDCGSCYTFAIVAAVEAAYAIKYGKKKAFSEQSLLDCSRHINLGCDGGYTPDTLRYLMHHGLASAESYPYVAKVGSCKIKKSDDQPILKGYLAIGGGDELALSAGITNYGPAVVGVDASLDTFRFYKSGIYNDPNCRSDKINHAVTAVGVQSGWRSYYIIRNSWGKSWGEDGYMRLARYKKNACGVARSALIPVL